MEYNNPVLFAEEKNCFEILIRGQYFVILFEFVS